ncbi:uncharacterized protein BBOV_IV008115 [Babesia bovis T2Bo]|uniref:uncharacterized protein n=1 Tax=Babesia bovis T2Bo TaxID=484906 RepID=UPI001D2FC3AA|nr:uncharacterized protein BBOV_IV008115 [Babesia bovis T2Bo]KAG6439971.1 hypothetical protein BBOV_IV008115 [Babesia bovis T2Bo]
MVEVYIHGQRRAEIESQFNLDWNLRLPHDVSLCEDILKGLELAISKLEESNSYLRAEHESQNDHVLIEYIEENELVLRRKRYQVEQIKSHIASLTGIIQPPNADQGGGDLKL